MGKGGILGVRRRGCFAGWASVVRGRKYACSFPIRCSPFVSTWLAVTGNFEVACLHGFDLLGIAMGEIWAKEQT